MNKITCYWCEGYAVGQGDHVPPKSLFPGGIFSCVKPIIVPSCEEHNQKKSGADEYLKFVLSTSSGQAPNDVMQSTVRGIMRYVKKGSKNLQSFGIERIGKEVYIDNVFTVNYSLLDEAIEKIARGLYYHHSNGKKKLIGHLAIYPIFLGIDKNADAKAREQLTFVERLAKETMESYEMHGELKDIFSYQVVDFFDFIFINMKFYGEKVVSVISSKLAG